jgi:hypothetical protein
MSGDLRHGCAVTNPGLEITKGLFMAPVAIVVEIGWYSREFDNVGHHAFSPSSSESSSKSSSTMAMSDNS